MQLVKTFRPELGLLDTISDLAKQLANALGVASVTAGIGTSLVALHYWLSHYMCSVQRLDKEHITNAETVLTFYRWGLG